MHDRHVLEAGHGQQAARQHVQRHVRHADVHASVRPEHTPGFLEGAERARKMVQHVEEDDGIHGVVRQLAGRPRRFARIESLRAGLSDRGRRRVEADALPAALTRLGEQRAHPTADIECAGLRTAPRQTSPARVDTGCRAPILVAPRRTASSTGPDTMSAAPPRSAASPGPGARTVRIASAFVPSTRCERTEIARTDMAPSREERLTRARARRNRATRQTAVSAESPPAGCAPPARRARCGPPRRRGRGRPCPRG
jgi:hypothetical protein